MSNFKSSGEFTVGDTIAIGDNVFTKQVMETVAHGIVDNEEIWSDQNGQQYSPTVGFVMGYTMPTFNKVMME